MQIASERGDEARAVDLVLAVAADEIVGIGREIDLRDAERFVSRDIVADRETRDAGQRDHARGRPRSR